MSKINVGLPIYNDVNDFQLSVRAGIFTGTGYPIGGIGNRSVILAHSDTLNRKYFTDSELLKPNDKFFINVAGRKLAYGVDRIEIVLPIESEDLLPITGENYIALMTYTPVRGNFHRLLVKGARIPHEKDIVEKGKKKEDSKVRTQVNWYPIIVVDVLSVIALIIIIKKIMTKRRGVKNEE